MNVKRLSFYLIALSLPFVLFILLESALIIAGYGHSYPLFIKAKQVDGYLQPNPDLIKRYFSNKSLAPNVSPDTYIFPKEKPTGVFRIVTLGGSTMAGFPYGRFGSIAGMLNQRIKASAPEQNIEVISVAMSSINSYTLLDIIDEVIEIEPDAVLIYAGHNEYLGVMGVGSSFAGGNSHAFNLLFLKLKDLRIFQAIQSLFYKLTTISQAKNTQIDYQAKEPNSIDETKLNIKQQDLAEQKKHSQNADSGLNERTLMAQVAANKNIYLGNEIYQAGLEQFSSNLSLILRKLHDAKVKTFVSNLVSNERDQAPFSSVENDTLDKAAKRLMAGKEKVKSTHVQAARDLQHAGYIYALAHAYLRSGDTKNAHDFFVEAKDLDLLRFRAPSSFNQIIENVSDSHNATFVDSYNFIHLRTKNSIIDKDIMLEHLHPNDYGYFLLAESFFQSIQQAGLLETSYSLSEQEALALSPLTMADKFYANYKIMQLTSDYPFKETKQATKLPTARNKIEAIGLARIQGKSWISAQEQLLETYQKAGNYERAANVAGLLFDALPKQTHVARVASLLYLKSNQPSLALHYALKSVELSPENISFRLSLAEAYFKLDKLNDAIDQLDQVLILDPSNQRARQIKSQLSTSNTNLQ